MSQTASVAKSSYPPRWRRTLRARVRKVRRSPVVWWVAVGLLAAVTASTVRSSLERAAVAESRYGDLRDVAVVVRPVERGAALRDGDVRSERRPSALLPDGAASDVSDAVGRVTLADLVPGDVVVGTRLAPHGRRGAGALRPAGRRAVAVPGGAGRPPLRAGDLVDVLATLADGETLVVVTGATVVDVDDQRDLVTIAVRPDDAPAVASAVATAAVTLALSG